ncbi:hypothetical protein V5P93_003304 [Actinokineospora auranticolor]|uniref:Uncharacterized protein n=1 Tax=Actinokineospora auranticolor TaxID=155976 RepID=A0A2S6H1R9_9PSEU|nr:hypothetical protein [Actinokineospora auranticolor]PPK71438.1 hypothetical protein CLV40_101628 [Actinokineospora auranticolor]
MDLAWVPRACALPTAEQPLRLAEFDALFTALRAVERPEPTRLRLVLDASVEAIARDLAARETECCSFFTFAFDRDEHLSVDISIPSAGSGSSTVSPRAPPPRAAHPFTGDTR